MGLTCKSAICLGCRGLGMACHSPMSENDRGYVETQNQFDFLGALPISNTRKIEYSAFNAVTFNWHRLIGASGAAHCFQARIKGSFLEVVAVSPLGTPTMIGATALNSAGMPSFAFTSGVFSAATAEPMTQLPSPMAQAASIRFSAASQQSASTKGPDGLAQMTMS